MDKWFRAALDKTAKNQPYSTCKVQVTVDGVVKECGDAVARPNYGKNLFLGHMESRARGCEFHKAVLDGAVAAKAKQQAAFRPFINNDPVDAQKDRLARLFAKKGWSHVTIDDPDFRATFGDKVPRGFDRRALRQRIISMADTTRSAMFAKHSHSDVYLQVDGGTINRIRHVNFSFSANKASYYLKSIRLDVVDAVALRNAIITVMDELTQAGLFVFAVICDNCSAYQLAMELVTELADEAVDVDDDLDEEFLRTVAAAAQAKGVFMLRCTCHSLQLYLGDLEKAVPMVAGAVGALDDLVQQYASTPERAATLINAQAGLGAERPKGLVRPVKTRWNSKPDGWRRALELKEYITLPQLMCVLTPQQWDSMEKALLLTSVPAAATHALEADDAGTSTLVHRITEIEANLSELARTATMKIAAQKAKVCWDRRMSSNLTSVLLDLYKFFDPAQEQRTFSTDFLEGTQAAALQYAEQYYMRRGKEFPRTEVAKEVGRFIVRTEAADSFVDWWTIKAVTFPHLAPFVIAIGECCHTEAAVERAFRAQSFIFNELRTTASAEVIDSEMMINMNWAKVYNPAEAASRAAAAVAGRERKREVAEAKYTELLAKRRRLD